MNAAETEEENKSMKQLAKNKDAFNLKVLQLKHSHVEGQHQKETCRQLIERIVVSARLRNIASVEMMDLDSFYCWQKYKRNNDDKALADTRWQELLADKDVYKHLEKAPNTLAL